MQPVMFRDINFIPPGGLFFYETHGERVTGRTGVEILPKVRALMLKYGIPGMAERVLAEYMCPRMDDPGRWCRGPSVAPRHVQAKDAISNALGYCSRRVVPMDVVARRMRACQRCPKHARDWCPTCSGHVSRMMSAFGGRRVKLPEDTTSGVCQCAKAYEIAIASVEYGDGEEAWPGVPDTCWRKADV